MKERRIPPKNRVKQVIKKILISRLKIESQEELCKLVLRELKKENKKFTLSPMRVKRIALEIPEIEVKAKTKKSISLIRIDKCPICEGKIVERKAKNLLNREIVIGYACTQCGYESDLEAFMPMKYEFILKSAKIRSD
jgi:predicted RNA-binding Zn-ribbon protein involved in translation (DUF1610 family)